MQFIQLSISKTCQERWEEMTPADQGRLCMACSKEVIDFSSMTDTEVLNFFSLESYSNICGRVYPDQLERVIGAEGIATRKSWYWKHIALFMFLFSKTSMKAQVRPKVVIPAINKEQFNIRSGGLRGQLNDNAEKNADIAKKYNEQSVLILVKDNETYLPLEKASLSIDIPGTHNKFITSTDHQGHYLVNNKGDDQISTISISAEGYETNLVTINWMILNSINSQKEIYMLKALDKPVYKKLDDITLKESVQRRMVGGMLGGMGIRAISIRSHKALINKIETFITDSLRIYPNPIVRGNTFNIVLKLKNAGIYFIQIADAEGRILLQKRVNAEGYHHTETLQSDPRWVSGIYYTRIFNSTNKLISTKSFIVSSNGF